MMKESLISLGHFHFLFVHFPIALVVMTVISEILWFWFKNPLFNHAARFMIISAALFSVPTVIFGIMLSYEGIFVEPQQTYFYWHRIFGFLTLLFALLTAWLREDFSRDQNSADSKKSFLAYYLSLFILFLLINITGTFGGALAFGIDSLF